MDNEDVKMYLRYIIGGALLLVLALQNRVDTTTILAVISGLLIPTTPFVAPIKEKLSLA